MVRRAVMGLVSKSATALVRRCGVGVSHRQDPNDSCLPHSLTHSLTPAPVQTKAARTWGCEEGLSDRIEAKNGMQRGCGGGQLKTDTVARGGGMQEGGDDAVADGCTLCCSTIT